MPIPSHLPELRPQRSSPDFRRRSWALAGMAILTSAVYLMNLMSIQIVNGETYYQQSLSTTLSVIPIQAARGEIYDAEGETLAGNRMGMNIVFHYAVWKSDGLEERLSILMQLCEERGESWYDPLPINEDGTAFTEDSLSEQQALKKALSLSSYASAEDCIYQLCEKYGLTEKDPGKRRKLAGICYGMIARQFSLHNNEYTFAEDVSVETALRVKELSARLSGVDIAEEDIRSYPDGMTAPHLIGTVGLMSAEEWKQYQTLDYQMDDHVGKFGLERYCEETLRGTDGEKTVEISESGEILSEETTLSPQSGNSVYLTLNAAFQHRVQKILSDYIEELRASGDPDEGGLVKGGAVAVLNPKTGAVLAMATCPSYDINDYYTDYSSLLETENTPLINRASDGLYRPGSTFKTVVAAAALQDKIITPEDTVECTGVYRYFDTVIEDNDFHPTCLGVHGRLAVSEALTKSCNIFFYDVGRRSGIDRINRYANLLGLGVSTGLELGGAEGNLSSPEYTASRGGVWTQGNVVQAAIGQMDTMVSPLQMAVQAMTIANRGVRYKTYLVDEVRSFDGETLISKTEPEVLSSFSMSETAFDAIKEGMIGAGERLTAEEYTLSGFDYPVAVKTGTPQVTTTTTNSCVIAFAPADDAEIAVGIMLEEGYGAARMLKNILEAWEETVREG